MALRIAPTAGLPTAASNTTQSGSRGAPSAPGLHDTLRAKLSLEASPSQTAPSSHSTQDLESSHPLEARVKRWQSTQDELKMNLLRRQYGSGEPIRRGMELRICRDGEWRPSCLGGSARVGEDVLLGRDTEITWEDIYSNDGGASSSAQFFAEMENRAKMNDF